MLEPLAFTYEYNGISGKLKTPIGVRASGTPFPKGAAMPWVGLWDTGATCSMVTPQVVQKLGLQPRDLRKMSGVSHTFMAPCFYVDIGLPNRLVINHMMLPLGELGGCDLLIGMDIISQGDFAVTNFGGKTVFTYRSPSIERIDFGIYK